MMRCSSKSMLPRTSIPGHSRIRTRLCRNRVLSNTRQCFELSQEAVEQYLSLENVSALEEQAVVPHCRSRYWTTSHKSDPPCSPDIVRKYAYQRHRAASSFAPFICILRCPERELFLNMKGVILVGFIPWSVTIHCDIAIGPDSHLIGAQVAKWLESVFSKSGPPAFCSWKLDRIVRASSAGPLWPQRMTVRWQTGVRRKHFRSFRQ